MGLGSPGPVGDTQSIETTTDGENSNIKDVVFNP